MNPNTIDFNKSPLSPIHTPKRRILGELQNFKPTSPYIERLKHSPVEFNPSTLKSPLNTTQIQHNSNFSPTLNFRKSPTLGTKSPILGCKSQANSIQESPLTSIKSPLLNSPIIANNTIIAKNTAVIANNTAILANNSPVTTKLKRKAKITKIFEERTKFKMENKENVKHETFMKFDIEEETRDCSFSGSFQRKTWTSAKLDFTDTLPPKFEPFTVPEKVPEQDLDDLESLQDLEAEFDSENFDQCTKYEIISTDSPDIISRGRNTSRKVTARSFNFGAPISDNEASTSFNRPATRMLNFDDEDFEFTSPAAKKAVSVKKSLKFNETPTKTAPFNETPTKLMQKTLKLNETPTKLMQNTLKFNETPTKLTHQRSDSSIGSMASPASSKLRLYPSESTTSMESGFISEFEEPFLDIEESNSPKLANFNELLSGQIKSNILTDRNFLKRPTISRSLSFHPESKTRSSLLSVLESSEEKKTQKRVEREDGEENISKRRRANCESPVQRRPVLQRAFSENNASIMSALARSALEPDLIGDFTQPFSLPLTAGDHSDLKSISCDTLAGLLRGDFDDTISSYQVIDCRYPYEFEGGHVSGAVNLYTPAQVAALVSSPPTPHTPHTPHTHRHVLIFHCEFSIERGPKLSRFLRSSDREKNKENYPQLYYPEIYLLHEGYRSFFTKYPQFCTPSGYTTMLDPKHKELLRKHRSHQPSSSGRRNRLLL